MPSDEPDRLRAVHELDLLDRRPEPDLDDIVAQTAQICGTPVCLVSVIDADRQCVKAGVGIDVTEAAGVEPLCAHTILGRGLFVVPDARVDARFADSPYVRHEPGLRFYAGAPLLTADGHALGALCVVDAVPRRLGLGQLRALRAMARQVTTLLELRHGAAVVARDSARRHELDRLHEELLPLLAGDLRDPLAELRRCVEVLRDLEFCPPEVAARLGTVAHAHAPVLVRLLDNLLRSAGSPGADRMADRQAVDLNSLMEWAVREVRPIAEARDVRLRFDAGPPAPVPADPRRLAQAMAHLMFSAVRFTPSAGRVQARVTGGAETPTVHLHAPRRRGDPAALFPHLVNGALRPGVDASRSATDEGLAALRTILDAHHATVALCDGPDEGTEFHVTFPSAG